MKSLVFMLVTLIQFNLWAETFMSCRFGSENQRAANAAYVAKDGSKYKAFVNQNRYTRSFDRVTVMQGSCKSLKAGYNQAAEILKNMKVGTTKCAEYKVAIIWLRQGDMIMKWGTLVQTRSAQGDLLASKINAYGSNYQCKAPTYVISQK